MRVCENWLLNFKDCEHEKRKAALAILYGWVAVLERLKLKLLYRLFLMSPNAEHILMLKKLILSIWFYSVLVCMSGDGGLTPWML